MLVINMGQSVLLLALVTLLACAAVTALPASDAKVKNNIARVSIKRSPMFLAQREINDTAETKSVKYCKFPTPCGWRILTYSDYAEITVSNKYCVCRPGQKCKLYERHSSESYTEFRCMKG